MLKLHFPESLKVYGCVFNINRGKPHNLEVIVDSWPDFAAMLCRPKTKGADDREGDFNIHSIYSRDAHSLRTLLDTPGVMDWGAYALLADQWVEGVDRNHVGAVECVAKQRGVHTHTQVIMRVLSLYSATQLQAHDSAPGCEVQPLRPEHAPLINSTWKYGGDAHSLNSVRSYIAHHPSLCVTLEEEEEEEEREDEEEDEEEEVDEEEEEDGSESTAKSRGLSQAPVARKRRTKRRMRKRRGARSGTPVAWLLLYQHCALGLLYTMPRYRRRGYARTLVSRLSQQLLEKGYPVYCFVEDGNDASWRLFQSLGFRDKDSYRAVWFEVNSRDHKH